MSAPSDSQPLESEGQLKGIEIIIVELKYFFDDSFWSFEPFLDTEGSRKLDPCPPDSSQWFVQAPEPLSSLHTSPSAGTLRGSFLCSEPSPGDWLKYFQIPYNSKRLPGVKSVT